MSEPRKIAYVPEDYIFHSSEEAFEKCPEQAVALVVGIQEFDQLRAEIEKLKWLARNPTAHPSAMDYAEHLERQLESERAKVSKLREALKKYDSNSMWLGSTISPKWADEALAQAEGKE
jgi:hypothetical protein